MATIPPPVQSQVVTPEGFITEGYRSFYDRIFTVLGEQSGNLLFSVDNITTTSGSIKLTATASLYLNDMKWPAELEVDKVFVLESDNTLSMVDPQERFVTLLTGDVKMTWKNTADTGFILWSEGSIGSALSGATIRANSDTQDLYELIWDNVSDTYASVAGGRGTSAENDFNDNKALTLPRFPGRALASAGNGSGLTNRSLGEWTGTETHTITEAEMPSHYHIADGYGASNLIDHVEEAVTNTQHIGSGTLQTSGTSSSKGSDTAHNNMEPSAFLNAMIKL